MDDEERHEATYTMAGIYKKVKEDRQADNGAMAKVYREHRAYICAGRKERGGIWMGLSIR